MKYIRTTYAIAMLTVVGIIAYAIYQVHTAPYLSWLGVFAIVSAALLLLMGLIVAFTFTLNFWYDAQVIPVEQWGAYLKRRSKLTALPPLLPAQPKVAGSTKVTELQPNIPRLADLIADNGLMQETEDGLQMLLGFRQDETRRYGNWPGVIAITGMQNVGKTITMVMLIVIALISGAHVVVCDTHHKKARSLYKKIEALSGYLTIATTEEEVLAETVHFSQELANRKRGSAPYPYVLFYDELCSLIRAKNEELRDALPTVMEEASQEGHGFDMHLVASIHDMSNQGIGDARLRGFWNFVYCHRMEKGQSKFIEAFNGKYGKQKASMVIAGLPAGHTMTRDDVNEIEYLMLPFADSRDTLTALKKLQENGSQLRREIPEKTVPPNVRSDAEIVTDEMKYFISEKSSVETQSEMKYFISREEKLKAEVRRLTVTTRMTDTEIIEFLWHVKAGGSSAFKEARDEFKKLKQEINAQIGESSNVR